MSNFNQTFELETSTGKIVPVEVFGAWQNDGIGGYEFWGQKCFDRGTNYAEIEGWKFDESGLTSDEILEITNQIENSLESWANLIEPEEIDYPEFDEDF